VLSGDEGFVRRRNDHNRAGTWKEQQSSGETASGLCSIFLPKLNHLPREHALYSMAFVRVVLDFIAFPLAEPRNERASLLDS
jgi:hypothetical protein